MLKWCSNIFLLFFITYLVSFYSCSGCSKSGLRNNQKNRGYSNTHNTSRSTSQIPDKKIRLVENDYNPTEKIALPLEVLYENCKSSVFIIYTSDGAKSFQGTGFFISETGIAVSNYHVFKGTSKGLEIIETYNGKKLRIEEVLSKDDNDDYIIFKVDLSNFKVSNPIPIAFDKPKIGEDVFAIGNPRGLESTLSKGIISGFRDNYIQTTTEITHGSSGGPLINMRGEVIGITTSGLGEANLNFAINIKNLPLKIYNLNN
jgi:serine protease Do